LLGIGEGEVCIGSVPDGGEGQLGVGVLLLFHDREDLLEVGVDGVDGGGGEERASVEIGGVVVIRCEVGQGRGDGGRGELSERVVLGAVDPRAAEVDGDGSAVSRVRKVVLEGVETASDAIGALEDYYLGGGRQEGS
jgi:hypothetical protein